MTNSMGDEQLRELLALEAVGALSDTERAELDAAIEDRPDLRAELESLRGAAATMADAVSEPPPSGLRARLLDTIAATPQEPPLPSAAPPIAPAPEPEAERPVAPVVPITAARRHRWMRWGAVAAAAAAAVIAVLVVSPWSGDDTGDRIAAVVDAPDARTIELTGELAGLRLVHSTSVGDSVLEGDGVSRPTGDNVYELWRLAGAAPEPIVRTFRPSDEGRVAVLVEGLDPRDDDFAVTEEPQGGSDEPTLPIKAMTETA
jgi:anti-sigma-K factor RskA